MILKNTLYSFFSVLALAASIFSNASLSAMEDDPDAFTANAASLKYNFSLSAPGGTSRYAAFTASSFESTI